MKGSTTTNVYIKSIVHGKYMDTIMAGSQGDSSTTYYCDLYYYTGSVGRVVYRSHNGAYANGGVSYADAGYVSSSTYAHIGSRLAFRGTLVKAASVAAFKALTEVS